MAARCDLLAVLCSEDGFLFRLEAVVPVPVWREAVPAFAVDDSDGAVAEEGKRADLLLDAVVEVVGFAVPGDGREVGLVAVFIVVRLGLWVTALGDSPAVPLAVEVLVWRAGLDVLSLADLLGGVTRRCVADFGLAVEGDFEAVVVAVLLLAV